MKRLSLWIFVLRLGFAWLMLPVDGTTGSNRERAAAAVAVANAQLQIALEKPELPDSSHRFQEKGPRQAREAFSATEGSRGISMTVSSDGVPVDDVIPAQLVIKGWRQGCFACQRLEKDIRKVLAPLGWVIGQHPTDQIQFVEIPQSEAAPQITLRQNGVDQKTWEGYRDPGFLSRELRQAWDQAPRPVSARTSGMAGSIRAASQIRQFMKWFRESIGEGIPAEVRWDRSGSQSFPLLARESWSAIALFGAYGHFELHARGAKNLPVDAIGFGYRIDGKDILFDADSIRFNGLADRLEVHTSLQDSDGPVTRQSSMQLAGSDPLTCWMVLSIIRDLWTLLQPSCDVILGGNVTATAVLRHDTITIEFQQCPSIRLVTLFTFNLELKRIVMSDRNVHVEFAGSRLVKSRDFRVE